MLTFSMDELKYIELALLAKVNQIPENATGQQGEDRRKYAAALRKAQFNLGKTPGTL